MCHAKPGPRCSHHLKELITAAINEMRALPETSVVKRPALQEKIRELRFQYDGTTSGQNRLFALVAQSVAADDEENAQKYRDWIVKAAKARQVRLDTLRHVTKDAERLDAESLEHDIPLKHHEAIHAEYLSMRESKSARVIQLAADREEYLEIGDTEQITLIDSQIRTDYREITPLDFALAREKTEIENLQARKAAGLPAISTSTEGYGVIYSTSKGTSGYLKKSYEFNRKDLTTYVPIQDVSEEEDAVILVTGEKIPRKEVKPVDIYYEKVSEEDRVPENRRVLYDIKKHY